MLVVLGGAKRDPCKKQLLFCTHHHDSMIEYKSTTGQSFGLPVYETDTIEGHRAPPDSFGLDWGLGFRGLSLQLPPLTCLGAAGTFCRESHGISC